jgi:Leucine-rich repeat (LRR) protein
VGGTIWVSSTNDIGLLGSSDLNIQNGGFTAYGNVQALEVASISFDNSTHFISLPVNGSVSDDDTTIIDPSTGDPAQSAQITDKKPTVNLGVKDLDGNEGVGGWVGFGDGDLFRQTYNTVSYGTTLTICASPEEGYRFDHWEDAYGGSFTDESQSLAIQVGVYVDAGYVAVFEELLPINATNFPDANFRSYIAENFDLNSDGYLSWAERNAVTSIDVSSKSITSLVGIKHFPELIRLYCYGNPDLREVDVRQNKKILYLQCYNCSKLERLFITGCSELTDLRCYSCNLTGINFKGCTNLKMLQCYGNRLSYLYLGECHHLGRVDCQNNTNLSELNINSEDLYILFCYGTKLDTLDVSSCPKLFDTYMQGEFSQTSSYDRYYWKDGSTIKGEIRCNKSAEIEGDLGIPVNQPNFPDPVFREFISNDVDLNRNGWLSPLEIEKCTGIGPEDLDFHNVKGIEFLTEMDNLLIDGAPNLTSIDLRANTKLEVIDICGNGLKEIKLEGLTKLYALYVESNALTEFDISALTLETFFCYNNPLTSLELGEQPDLKTLYAHHTDLTELDLSGSPILLDAYLNGTVTEYDGYVKYSGGSLGGTLYIDADQTVITEATPDHIPGDINGDGKVNNKDVTRLQRYLRGEEVDVNPAALDVNGDGKVNNKDLTRLQRYLRGEDVEIH